MRLRFYLALSLVMLSTISYSDSPANIQLGDTKAAVISKLGQPKGQMKNGKTETLIYAGGDVTLVDGKVTDSSVPDSQPQSPQKAQVQQEPASNKQAVAAGVMDEKLLLDPAARNKSPFLLPTAAVPPMSLENLDLKRFFALWNAFDHAPYELSGFSHLTLPFHYECEGVQGTIEEAHAFSFLLSSALDWTPGCYCAGMPISYTNELAQILSGLAGHSIPNS